MRSVLTSVIGIAVLVALWETAARLGILATALPAPSRIAGILAEKWNVYLFHLVPTLQAAALGLGLAIACSLALTLLIIAFPRTRVEIFSFIVVISSIPLIALTPLFIAFLGSGISTRAIIAALSSFLPIASAVTQGAGRVDPNLNELFRILNAGRLNYFAHCGWQMTLPFILAGLKTAGPIAVLATVIAEWAGADRGLGLLIVQSMFAFNVPQTWGAICLCCGLAYGVYLLIAVLETAVLRRYHPAMASS